jgi:hypothetical protein
MIDILIVSASGLVDNVDNVFVPMFDHIYSFDTDPGLVLSFGCGDGVWDVSYCLIPNRRMAFRACIIPSWNLSFLACPKDCSNSWRAYSGSPFIFKEKIFNAPNVREDGQGNRPREATQG